jgi:hypothetical protein
MLISVFNQTYAGFLGRYRHHGRYGQAADFL